MSRIICLVHRTVCGATFSSKIVRYYMKNKTLEMLKHLHDSHQPARLTWSVVHTSPRLHDPCEGFHSWTCFYCDLQLDFPAVVVGSNSQVFKFLSKT